MTSMAFVGLSIIAARQFRPGFRATLHNGALLRIIEDLSGRAHPGPTRTETTS